MVCVFLAHGLPRQQHRQLRRAKEQTSDNEFDKYTHLQLCDALLQDGSQATTAVCVCVAICTACIACSLRNLWTSSVGRMAQEEVLSAWLFNAGELHRSPSVRAGMSSADELAQRLSSLAIIRKLGTMVFPGNRFAVPSASVFFHRFYTRQSMLQHAPVVRF